MTMQQVEFEFPDPDKKQHLVVEVEPENEKPVEIEVEGAVGREVIGQKKKTLKEDDVEVEVIDDTPTADRNRKPSAPPEEVTEEELESYSDKVKKRIQHFSKGYHDERRAKEQALREREELERYAKVLIDENQKLKGSVDKGHNALLESAKKQVQIELQAAKQKYKEAYEAGDTDAIIAAQEGLNNAQIRLDRVNSVKPKAEHPAPESLQPPQVTVQHQQTPPPSRQPARDEKAEAWRNDNPWFGSDDEMTAAALGYHSKLVKQGVNPTSDEYYEKVNSRMRQLFPESFDDDIDDELEQRKTKKAPTVVAPATRSTGPIKVQLSETQVALAKRMGVSLSDYAKQVALLRRS